MRRQGFTLVELVAVVAIIAILAGMVSGALIVARNSGREAATKATIEKLHQIISAKCMGYQTRRLRLDNDDIRWLAVNRFGWVPASPQDEPPMSIVARVLLAARRDLMRMELPERTADIQQPPLFWPPTFTGTGPWLTYRAVYLDASGQPKRPSQHPSAQMLYLIVAVGPEMREARIRFTEAEKADTDGDGRADVFVDGWGQPIYWLRWAPGFDDSDIQHPRDPAADPLGLNHDPLDWAKTEPAAFALHPLIYSPGPDEEYGLWQDFKPTASAYPYRWVNTTYTPFTDPDLGRQVLVGSPLDDRHYDNIHNHRVIE